MSGGNGFPTLLALGAVMVQTATGILPTDKPAPAPVAAPVAAIAVPAVPPPPPASVEVFAKLPDVVPIPKPRPKSVRKAAHPRKHKPVQTTPFAPPASPLPLKWSVLIRIGL